MQNSRAFYAKNDLSVIIQTYILPSAGDEEGYQPLFGVSNVNIRPITRMTNILYRHINKQPVHKNWKVAGIYWPGPVMYRHSPFLFHG